MAKPMRTILFLLLVLTFVGCGTGDTTGSDGGTSTNPCIANPESCMGTCTGQCAPDAPGWPAVFFQVWSGPAGSTPPNCPTDTPHPGHGYLDTPPDSVSCSACSCGPSQGGCFQPSQMTANNTACPADAPGVQHVIFDPPTVWDGTCTAKNPVPSADSLTVSLAQLAPNSQCGASGVTVTDVQGGKTIAVACSSPSNVPDGKCPGGTVCAYDKMPGFLLCIAEFSGDVACPEGWPNKRLYYDDHYLCKCSCGDPVGETCSTTITAYEDGACTKPLGSAAVSAGKPAACVDVPPGSAFGSKSATPPAYIAGTCAPKLEKNHPWTLCCMP